MEDRTQEARTPLPRKWTIYKLLGTRRETYWIYYGAESGKLWGILLENRSGAWKMKRERHVAETVASFREVGRVNVARLIETAVMLEAKSIKAGGAKR